MRHSGPLPLAFDDPEQGFEGKTAKMGIDYSITYNDEWKRHLESIRWLLNPLSDAKFTVKLAKIELRHAQWTFRVNVVWEDHVTLKNLHVRFNVVYLRFPFISI